MHEIKKNNILLFKQTKYMNDYNCFVKKKTQNGLKLNSLDRKRTKEVIVLRMVFKMFIIHKCITVYFKNCISENNCS